MITQTQTQTMKNVPDQTGNSRRKKMSMKSSGIFHFWNSIRYSLAGYKEGLLHDSSIRQETIVAVCALPVIYFLPELTPAYKMLMFFAIVCVLAAEFFNSALEDAVDLACPEIHPIAKRAKDFASGAVCLITCSNFVIWGVALWTIFF